MCILDKTSNPTFSQSSSWRQRRPDLVLVKSPKWSYSAYRDRAYPSPPMSGSPGSNSPRRSTPFAEDRSGGNFNAAVTSAPGIQSLQTPRTSMEGPIAIPSAFQQHQHHQQQQYGQYRPQYAEQQRYELQPRPVSTHPPLAPHYQVSYGQSQQEPGPLPLVPTSRSQVPGMATFQGPTSLSGSTNPRIARTSRRAKAHVARACQNCKKAHLSCDEARPCARCVSSGKQATCIDVEHKKRGRPRLRDDRDQRLEQAAAAAVAAAVATAQASRPNELSQSGRGGHRRGNSLRLLRSQGLSGESVSSDGSGQMQHQLPDIRYHQQYQQGPPEPFRNVGPPLTAFLNMELRILKASDELRRLLADSSDIRGRPLSEFVAPQHEQALQRIQSELRDERSQREPTFLPGIFPDAQEQGAVANLDIEAGDTVSHGSQDRLDTYSFRLAGGRTEQLQVRFRLARTSTFFATMTLQRQYQPQPPPPPQYATYGRPGGYLPMPQPSPTQIGFHHAGPPSPYNSSAPGSPFSTLHTALITTLPPASSSSTSYSYAPSQARSDQASFSRYPQVTGVGMYPPPPPTLSRPPSALSESRPHTARERRRPEPLSNLQLPPIVTSAPTTPMTGAFYEQGGPRQPSSAPRRRSRSPEQQQRQSEDEEEDSRKRRRLNIKEIIER